VVVCDVVLSGDDVVEFADVAIVLFVVVTLEKLALLLEVVLVLIADVLLVLVEFVVVCVVVVTVDVVEVVVVVVVGVVVHTMESPSEAGTSMMTSSKFVPSISER
jgi:hypothetical protein